MKNLCYFNLKANEQQNILESNFRTGFLGFQINFNSLKFLYKHLLETKKLEYLMMYKFSQDHLELFFGLIRYRTGRNDNPTCKQFIQSYKRLVVNKCIKNVNIGNVAALPDILSVPCSYSKKKNLKQSEMNIHLDLIDRDLDEYSCDILTYLAGYIQAIQITKKLNCVKCCDIVKKLLSKPRENALLGL